MTSEKLTWREAVDAVLRDARDPMHYTDIADEIAARKLRGDELGAKPANTVATVLTVSIRDEGAKSPFIRIERGIYALRDKVSDQDAYTPAATDLGAEGSEISSETTGLVNAFGMFWDRAKVAWAAPKILGQQQAGSTRVDFGEQRGVYLLHDAQGVVYVGRATDQGLGRRLAQHVNDRLGGRWTRFSWLACTL